MWEINEDVPSMQKDLHRVVIFLQKNKEACPFRNIEYAFSYSTRGGAKVCEEPASKLDTCIEEEKMVFQFQACPDVPGSERAGKCYWFLSILSVADLQPRNRPRLFMQVGHETTDACIGKKHFFTK